MLEYLRRNRRGQLKFQSRDLQNHQVRLPDSIEI